MPELPRDDAPDAREAAGVSPEPSVLPHDPSDLSHADAARLNRIWPGYRPPSTSPDDQGERGAMPWRPQDLGDVLRHQLQASLDFEATGHARRAGPRTFAQLLADPSPPLDLLRRVKDWAKSLMQGERDEAGERDLPKEVAGVLYFAAICAALARQDQRITSLGDAEVAKGATWALRLPWVDEQMGDLFQDALAVLSPADPSPVSRCAPESS